jgi:hypothetical protein
MFPTTIKAFFVTQIKLVQPKNLLHPRTTCFVTHPSWRISSSPPVSVFARLRHWLSCAVVFMVTILSEGCAIDPLNEFVES